MARRRQHHTYRKRLMSDMNVVPYIDVMLVLLIIFMVTAPILTQGVNVDLPKAKASPVSQVNQNPFIVTINKQGQLFTNREHSTQAVPLSTRQLQAQAESWFKRHPQGKTYVRADQSVPYGKVVKVMAWLQHAGAGQIGLITHGEQDQS